MSDAGRVLTSHVGSLIRPPELVDFLLKQQDGEPYDTGGVRGAAAAIRRQRGASAGRGSASISSATANTASRSAGRAICCERLSGFEERPGRTRPDRSLPSRARTGATSPSSTTSTRTPAASSVWASSSPPGPLGHHRPDHGTPGQAAIERDIANFKSGARQGARRAGFPAGRRTRQRGAGPQGRVLQDSEEEALFAIADALSEEYRAIIDAGLIRADRRRVPRELLRRHGAARDARGLPQVGAGAHRGAEPRARRASRRSGSATTCAGAAGTARTPTTSPLKDIIDLVLQGQRRRLSRWRWPTRATSTSGGCGRT